MDGIRAVPFSSLGDHFDVPANRLYALRDRLRADRVKIIDLVSGNVNDQGIEFPAGHLKQALAIGQTQARRYQPDPFGRLTARRAIERFYKADGISIPAAQILLTPGTSLSYWYAFKALANAGDEILCPQPNYPLFESIAALCGVTLTSYPLVPNERWAIDLPALEAAITPKTRAVVLISPHNPTGAVASPEEIDGLVRIARTHGLAIISDEVFSPFLFTRKTLPRPAGCGDDALVLTLNGFSKMLALPGFKIGWMAVTGPREEVRKLLRILEMISDTFLPVNEIAQAAVPALLRFGKPFVRTYAEEIQRRAEAVIKPLQDLRSPRLLAPEGGFYAAIPLREGCDDEAAAISLLKEERLLLHPGYFYDLKQPYLVMSLVNRAKEFKAVMPRLLKALKRI
jgi:alanine-synthesizing transaminase